MIEKSYLILFATVFLAELGDKTQLVTVLSAGDSSKNPWLVFAFAASALVLSCALGTLAGTLFAKYLTVVPLKLIAGICFIGLGLWTVWEHYRA